MSFFRNKDEFSSVHIVEIVNFRSGLHDVTQGPSRNAPLNTLWQKNGAIFGTGADFAIFPQKVAI